MTNLSINTITPNVNFTAKKAVNNSYNSEDKLTKAINNPIKTNNTIDETDDGKISFGKK